MRNKAVPAEVRPINSIMALKSNDDLRSYLEDRPELNIALMREKNGSTLLHFAAFKNQFQKLKIYMLHFEAFARESLKNHRNGPSFEDQLKAWINVQSHEGMAATHFAVLHGNIEMVDFLERHRANMQATTSKQENLLFMAVENNRLHALAHLLEHRQGKLPFDADATNQEGNTPLHLAAVEGHYAVLSYLLTLASGDLDRDAVNNEGATALMLAVRAGHKDVVKRMLMKGARRDIRNQQDERAIDIALAQGNLEMVRVLNDDFSSCEKLKIACNVKIVYRVQKPTRSYSLVFLLMFHLLFLPSHVFSEVTLLDSPYLFYGLAGTYYFLVMTVFYLLTKKHPRKHPKDIQDLPLPLCSECRDEVRHNEFHCFTCGVCIWRYDHHCPWINNCVSALNVGKFTLFLCLLILTCLEVLFLSLSLQTGAFKQISRTTLIPLEHDSLETVILVNSILSSLLAIIISILIFSLLGDQLKNMFSNSTSYERAKNLKKESLLTTHDRSSLNDVQSEMEGGSEEEEQGSCFGNCCLMLRQDYSTVD